MLKRILAASLVLCMALQLTVFADSDESSVNRVEFSLDVGMLSSKQLQNIPQNFTKLDISAYMNRDIKDEVEGDHKGGWSDQGDNDLRMFDQFGDQEMLGIPFYFVDPASNDGKAVLGLRGQNDTGLPTEVTVPVNRVTAGAYFIHASPFCSGTCGTYTWVYEDGSEAYIDIDKDEEICDFWGYKSFDFVRPAWTATKADGSQRSLYLFAMNNPYPDKKVASLRFETSGGGAYIMIMAITLTDNGPYLTQTENAKYITTTTYGWYNYERFDVNKLKDSPLSAAKYLEKPAGTHGAVKADGEDLKFEDGTEARFWGTEILGEAAFPEKEQAETIALEIANAGFNLVRFADFDEAVLDDGSESTKLSDEKMEKLCYFISELKKNGVYVSFSMLSKRMLRSADGIDDFGSYPEGYGEAAYFDEQLIELQRKFNRDFFEYDNKFTQKKIGEDEAVISIELVNGLSIFDMDLGYGRKGIANEHEKDVLKGLFNDYLLDKYGTTEELEKNWTSTYDRNEYETLEDKTIEIKENYDNVLVSDGYKKDLADFYIDLLRKYYSSLKEDLRKYNKLVSINSNGNGTVLADVYANAETDLVSRKYYDADIMSISDKITEDSILSNFAPMTESRTNMINKFAENAVADKPYFAIWGTASYSLYQAQPSIIVPFFAAVNGWSAIEHSYVNGGYSSFNKMDDFFAVYNNPVKLALAPVSAAIFYSTEEQPVSVKEFDINNILLNNDEYGLSSDEVYKSNTRIAFTEDAAYSEDTSSPNIIKTDNFYWDISQGFVDIRTPKVEAVTGLLQDKEELPSFSIDANNSYLTAALMSVDENDILSSKHMIFTAAASAQNNKSRVILDRQRYDSVGEEGILQEPVVADIVIKRQGDAEVYALDPSGERSKKLTVTKDRNGYIVFDISQEDCAASYEILIK